MKKLFFITAFFLTAGQLHAIESPSAAVIATNGSGGTNTAGQSIQADEFSGSATYNITIPVPPARGGIEPQLNLNYNSSRKNPNSWVGYGWELDMGSIERTPEPCDGNGGTDFSKCNIIDYYSGKHFQVRFAGQTETLELKTESIDPTLYGLPASANVQADLYAAKTESAFNFYIHLTNTSDHTDNGWYALDKSGRIYSFGTTLNSLENEYHCPAGSVNWLCTSVEWVSRWMLDSVTDTNNNNLTIDYGSDRLPDEITYQDISIIFNKVEYYGATNASYSFFPTFRQGFLSRSQTGKTLQSIEIYQNGARLQKFFFNISNNNLNANINKFSTLWWIEQSGATDSTYLPVTLFDYYEQDTLSWSNSAYAMTASTSNTEGTSTGLIGYYTQFADMNADGLPDMVTSYDDSDYLYVYYNNGSEFEYSSTKSKIHDAPFTCESSGSGIYVPCYGRLNATWNQGHQWTFLMDMNGDGLPDRVIGHGSSMSDNDSSATGYFSVYYNTGNGWLATEYMWADPYIGSWGGSSDNDKWLMDMNGDGLPDRVVSTDCNDHCDSDNSYDDNSFLVYYNTGAGFADTPVYWADPIAGFMDDAAGRLSDTTDSKVYATIKDFNGDGLPDRIWRSEISSGGVSLGYGFGVALNRNGIEWANPAEDSAGLYDWIIDGIDNVGMVDPVIFDSGNAGYISSSTIDLIDMNGDGYLDRVEGDRSSGVFNVYYFQGMTNDSSIGSFSSAYSFTDPATDISGEWGTQGYVTKGDTGETSGNPNYYVFMQDITGDGYPDRVSVAPGDSGTTPKHYYVYPMLVNNVEFSDVSGSGTGWVSPVTFTQPVGALKSVTDHLGNKTGIEYLPSSYPRRWGTTPNHRFLPFNLFTVHKLYTLDYTMPASDSSVEATRWPEMRWTTYDYWGGNFFTRHAVKVIPDPMDTSDELSSPQFTQFNGFQTVEKKVYKADGETWNPITTTTLYHQALGDIDTVESSEERYFEADAYTHFALSGKVFKTTVDESNSIWFGSQTLVTEENDWNVNELNSSDNYNCSGDFCFPYLHQRTKTITEDGATTNRISSVVYDYDDTNGNVTSEKYYTGIPDTGTLLLQKDTSYYSESAFDPIFHIRDRPETQTQSDGTTTYRSKDFSYDYAGNPTTERFMESSGNYVTINRTFNSNGTLSTITDIDGVTKTLNYDADGLFPETENVTLPNGSTLITQRTFNRLNGEADSELNNSSVGKSTVFDDFGRPIAEYIVSATGTLELNKEYDYEYTDYTVEDWPGIILLKTSVYAPRNSYADTSTNPMEISYSDGVGNILQKCSYTERGDYRQVQYRQFNGSRETYQTEPVFDSDCSFNSTISSATKTYLTEKDYQGRTTYIEPPAGDAASPTGNATITYSTNSSGQLVKTSTTSTGIDRVETFDYNDRLLSVIDDAGSALEYTYNAVGDLTDVHGNGSLLTHIDYDLLGRKTAMTDADMGNWSYDYNNYGQMEKQTDNIGNYVSFTYDSLGRIERKESHNTAGTLQKYETYTYDIGDGSHNVTNGELFKVDEYDSSNTLLRSTKYGYDADYRRINTVTRTIPAIGDLTQTISNDFRGEVQSVSYPGGENLYYVYDRIGNAQKICNTSNCDTTTGEVYYSIDPTSGYDKFGALQKETFGNGITTDYSYYPNSHRLQEKKTSKDSTIYSQRQYAFDEYANITSITDALSSSGSAALSIVNYDTLNRMTGYTTTSTGIATTLEYDSVGNIKKNTAYSASNYEYTSSRPHAVTKIGSDNFDYDDNGNMISDPNRTMTYDSENHLTKVTMKSGYTVNYEYDYTGARVSKTSSRTDIYRDPHNSTTYYLGDAMEIKDENLTFHIHANNQRIATKTLGNITDILASGGASLRNIGIDPKINNIAYLMPFFFILFALVTIGSFRPVRVRIVMPDSTALPVPLYGIRHPSSPVPVGAKLIQYWSRYTNAMHEALHLFHYRFATKLMACTLVLLTFIQFPLHLASAGDAGIPASSQSDANYFYYYQSDHLGSGHILTEGNRNGGKHMGILYNRGTLLQRIEYSPFGQESYVLNPNLKFDPRYTGQQYDIETGLYYYKARFYNPAIGRFIQPDTVVPSAKDLQSYNRYSYVNNNPLKYIDPSGHGFWDFIKGVGRAIGSAFMSALSFGSKLLSFGVQNYNGSNATSTASFDNDESDKFYFEYIASGGMLGQIVGDDDAFYIAGDDGGTLDFSLSNDLGGWDDMKTFGDGSMDSLADNNLVGALDNTGFWAQSDLPYPLGYGSRSEYVASMSIADARNSQHQFEQQQYWSSPEAQAQLQSVGDAISRDFIAATGIAVGVAAGPVAASACMGNPAACTSLGAGLISGFAEGSGIGTTKLPPNDAYEQVGTWFGEGIGSFFDF